GPGADPRPNTSHTSPRSPPSAHHQPRPSPPRTPTRHCRPDAHPAAHPTPIDARAPTVDDASRSRHSVDPQGPPFLQRGTGLCEAPSLNRLGSSQGAEAPLLHRSSSRRSLIRTVLLARWRGAAQMNAATIAPVGMEPTTIVVVPIPPATFSRSSSES